MEEKRHGSDSKHHEIHKPHVTVNPLEFGFMFLFKCVRGTCVIRDAEYYVVMAIFEM